MSDRVEWNAFTYSAAANRARKLRAKKSNIHLRKLIPNVDVALLSTQFPCSVGRCAVREGVPLHTITHKPPCLSRKPSTKTSNTRTELAS